MFERILERHDDVGTMGIVLYTDSDDYLYKDAECTEGLTIEELDKIKFHPLMVVSGSTVFRATAVYPGSIESRSWGNDQPFKCIDASVPE